MTEVYSCSSEMGIRAVRRQLIIPARMKYTTRLFLFWHRHTERRKNITCMTSNGRKYILSINM